jgi:type I restriction enzyme, S subunit
MSECCSNDWRSYKLGDLFTERVETNRINLPLLSITGQAGIIPRDISERRNAPSEDKSKYLRIVPGDIGYNTMRMWQGVCGISKHEGIVSPAYTICIPSKKIDGLFASYLFKFPPVVHLFRRYSQGLVDDTLALKFHNFSQVRVSIPASIVEQQLIAKILDSFSLAIDKCALVIEAKRARKSGLLQDLLTGKKRFKEFGGKQWKAKRIGDLFEECARYVDWDDNCLYQFASIRRNSGGLFDRGTSYGHTVKTKVLKLLKSGDLLISKRQVTHGAWGMVTEPFDGFGVSDEYDVLVNRDDKMLDMRFFNYLSQTRRLWHMAYLASNGVHIEKLIFNFKDFAKEMLRIPPTVDEQKIIANVLSACDREIELLHKQLSALKELKRGLMQKLLTGEVRVKIPKGA